MAMTCNTEYNEKNGQASNVAVSNYYGDKSITVADEPTGSWDSFGTKSSLDQ